jgi:hypothetical protein
VNNYSYWILLQVFAWMSIDRCHLLAGYAYSRFLGI